MNFWPTFSATTFKVGDRQFRYLTLKDTQLVTALLFLLSKAGALDDAVFGLSALHFILRKTRPDISADEVVSLAVGRSKEVSGILHEQFTRLGVVK